MKKLLLAGGLVLGLGLSGTAQNTMELKSNSRETLKAKTIEKAENVNQISQIRNGNDDKTNFVDLTRVANLHRIGYLHVPTNVVSYDPASKAVVFSGIGMASEEGAEYGRIIYRHSTDNGITWNDPVDAFHPYYGENLTQPNATAQFTLGFLMNPTKSNNIEDVRYSYYSSNHYNYEDNLSKHVFPYNLLPLGQNATKNDFKVDENTVETGFFYPIESYKTEKNIFIIANVEKQKKNDEGGTDIDPQKQFVLVKGAIENNEINYKRIIIDVEDIVKEELGDIEIDATNRARITFNEDASVGYIAFNVYSKIDKDNPLTWYSRFFILKSTDAGETWTKFDNFDSRGTSKGMEALNLYWNDDWWARTCDFNDIPVPPANERDCIFSITKYRGFDLAMDKDQNPIMIINLTPSHKDIIFPSAFKQFFVHKVDNVWTAENLQTNSVRLRYLNAKQKDEYIMDNRFTFINTPDKSCNYIMYIDSDYEQDGEIIPALVRPDIYYAAYKDGELIQAGASDDENNKRKNFNLTHDSETARGYCFWANFASEMSVDPKDSKMYRAHAVVLSHEDNNEFDQEKSITYRYVKNLRLPVEPGSDHKYIPEGVNEVDPVFASVSQNLPNPFNGTTKVNVELTEAADLSLVVTNVSGQRIMNIEKGHASSGKHSFEIDGSNLDAGVYFYSVFAGKSVVTKKMIIE